jgi:hypothetical protein
VNIDLTDEAAEFGRQARRALADAGGDELLQAAELDPEGRAKAVEPVLAGLGVFDLDPLADADELEAAAAVCRSAGWWAAPYPVAERLARLPEPAADGLLVVDPTRPAAAVAGLDLSWIAVTPAGDLARAVPRPPRQPARQSAFVTELDLTPIEGSPDRAGTRHATLALVLGAWTLLGMLDRAMALTREHITVRRQFGKHLSDFQGVQFQLTDAEVERAGLEMLAKYTLWQIGEDDGDLLTDALALRLAALEAAQVVFRIGHQLHGATGFCDETVLSWLSRHSQPLRRQPLGLSATQDLLTRRLGSTPPTGIFTGGPT